MSSTAELVPLATIVPPANHEVGGGFDALVDGRSVRVRAVLERTVVVEHHENGERSVVRKDICMVNPDPGSGGGCQENRPSSGDSRGIDGFRRALRGGVAMKIACVLAGNFEDSEFQEPYDAYKKAGHDVTVIGNKAGDKLEGKKHQVTATVDKSIDEVKPEQFDALFIPGGYSPDQLRANPKFVDFTKAFFTGNKPVFAICHGPQLLISAGVVGGRKLTAWKTIQADLGYTGANVVDEPVVVDGNLVTSRQPDDIPQFIEASEKLLAKVPAGATR
jgi:protease I